MSTSTQVPAIQLNNGIKMPQIGIGVFKVEDGSEVEQTVAAALDAGYRAIDTAAIYDNEAGVGRAIANSNVSREELFVTSKLWNDDQGYDSTLTAFQSTLDKLQLDYLDLYLIHWPKPKQDKFRDTWRAFEKLYDDGKIKAIGVSNFKPAHLDTLLADANIVPAVNQIELHPMFTQLETREYCDNKGIKIEAWSPLMQAGQLLEHDIITKLAKEHNKEPAQIVLRWHIQSGFLVIPKSVNPERIRSNIDIFDFELSDEEMTQIDGLNQNNRIGPNPDTM